MLHILLTILKVIGIILLVILALILALILIVLFVPVRYRIHVKKEDGPLEADGVFSWFLKLVRVIVTYRDKSGTAQLKVLWFRLKSFRIPAGEGHPKKPEVKDAGKPVLSAKPLQVSAPPSGTGRIDADDADRNKPDAGQAENRDTDTADTEEGPAGKPSKVHTILEALPDRTVRITEKICNLLLKLIDLPFDAYDRIDDTVDRTEKKIDALRKKIDPFLSVEADHMFRKSARYLMYLIHAWKPRRAEGYLEFGTGRPDITGELSGLIYLVLPDHSEKFDLRPDFYNKVLRANLTISGRIRLWRLAYVGIRVLLDREFWELLRMIRNKPPRKGHRGKKKRARRQASDNKQ